MNFYKFISKLVIFSVIIPAAVMCYMPMKNQLKYSGKRIFLKIACIFGVFIPLAAGISALFCIDGNLIVLPALVLFFVYFHNTVRTNVSQSLAVFTFVCELSAFPANFAYAFDAYLHPANTYLDFSPEAGMFQLITAVVLTAAFLFPLRKWGAKLIDSLEVKSVWITLIGISAVLLVLNIAIIPHNYSVLYVERCFPLYIMILSALFLLVNALYIVIYYTSIEILKNADFKKRIQFFEMEQQQYKLQQKYIEDTEKQRHDFRQSIFTLKQLAENEDLSEIRNYISKYAREFPAPKVNRYCKNNALNALLNYYTRLAEENSIQIRWEIEIPSVLRVSDPDLCSLLGNLIENSISGCATVSDTSDRYHYLSVTVQNEVNMYIVSTNNFNGVVKMKNNRYFSTKHSGNGIGIHSIEIITEKYNGTANFYHSANEFYADIMLKIQ